MRGSYLNNPCRDESFDPDGYIPDAKEIRAAWDSAADLLLRERPYEDVIVRGALELAEKVIGTLEVELDQAEGQAAEDEDQIETLAGQRQYLTDAINEACATLGTPAPSLAAVVAALKRAVADVR